MNIKILILKNIIEELKIKNIRLLVHHKEDLLRKNDFSVIFPKQSS